MSRPHLAVRILLGVARGVLALLGTLAVLYAFGAIYYDGPLGEAGSAGNLGLAAFWLLLLVAALVYFRRRALTLLVGLLLVIFPWSLIQPSNDRDWQPDFRRTGWVEVDGDRLTFHNVRDFDYTRDGELTERWTTRTHSLSDLVGIDYFHDAFGGDLLAHPILSFDFGDSGSLCLSIETRREKGESFSALGGLFKLYELQYLFGTEADFIRVRTNIRDEPVYLYRTVASPTLAREMLMESIAVQNRLRDHPEFYNVISHNCTTSLRAQTPADRREAFDWRMLVNGRLDEYLYQKDAFVDAGLPFPELREQAHINDAAREAHADPDFAGRIREGRVGFDERE